MKKIILITMLIGKIIIIAIKDMSDCDLKAQTLQAE